MISDYPCRLLLVVKARQDERCPERLALARDLLGGADSTLHSLALKVCAGVQTFSALQHDDTVSSNAITKRRLKSRTRESLNAVAPPRLQVKARFSEDLRYIVESGGKCKSQLFMSVLALARSWKGDSQELEGCMSLIRIAAERGSSQLSLPLLDSRVGTIKVGMASLRNNPKCYVKTVENVHAA